LPRKSGINGKGCFALVPLRARRKVGELIGEKINNREAARRVAKGGKVRICQIDDRWSIDASHGGDATAYINHSCEPNCFSRVQHGRMLFFALRDIAPGEELTLDYTPSQHPGRPCTCGAAKCRKVMA
jgi:SET domain-containing protein